MAQRSISWEVFKRAIRTNRKARLLPSATSLGAMVSLYLPRHPDSDELGFWEVAAVMSPTFFVRCSKEDVEHEGKWVRGYNSFFRGVARMKDPHGNEIFDKRLVKCFIPDAYERFDSKRFKQDVREKNTPDFVKTHDKIKGVFKPMKDTAWRPRETSTVYSLPDVNPGP